MIIEIFLDPISVDWTIKQKVSSFRYWRDQKTVNQPNKNNVYKIKQEDLKMLVHVMDHVAIVCEKSEADFISWNLCLKIIDEKKWNVDKDWFMDNITGDHSIVVQVKELNRDWLKRSIREELDSVALPIIWNVTSGWKSKIYHTPEDEWYEHVEFDEERGDAKFTTEEEAIDAWFVRVQKTT